MRYTKHRIRWYFEVEIVLLHATSVATKRCGKGHTRQSTDIRCDQFICSQEKPAEAELTLRPVVACMQLPYYHGQSLQNCQVNGIEDVEEILHVERSALTGI